MVEAFYYVTETIVGDFTILKHPVLQKTSYMKTFPPVNRVESCTKCNASGFTKNLTEIKE